MDWQVPLLGLSCWRICSGCPWCLDSSWGLTVCRSCLRWRQRCSCLWSLRSLFGRCCCFQGGYSADEGPGPSASAAGSLASRQNSRPSCSFDLVHRYSSIWDAAADPIEHCSAQPSSSVHDLDSAGFISPAASATNTASYYYGLDNCCFPASFVILLCFVDHFASSIRCCFDSRGSRFGYFGSVCAICWFAMVAVIGFGGSSSMFVGRWCPFYWTV